MSVSGIAFWSSDYAYEIMGTKRISYPAYDIPQKTGEVFGLEEEFVGFRPRADEYLPSSQKREIPHEEKIKLLGEKDEEIEKKDEIKLLGEKDKTAENAEEKDKNIQKSGQYSEEEKKVIDELKSRDMEVRNHEQAHIAAGGAHIRGGASYTYQSGPDGKQYAIGGEVSIDTSPVKGNPEATIAKMQTVISAAMAPANPSGTDRAVAAAASQAQAAAMAEILEKKGKETTQNTDDSRKTEQNFGEYGKSDAANKNTDKNIENSQKTERNFGENGEDAEGGAVKAQNNIVSAISAYTAGIQKFASKIDFTA